MHIREWPGLHDRMIGRVPTVVAYEAGRRRNTSWGFECPMGFMFGSSRAVRDKFTLYLDPTLLSLVHQVYTEDIFGSLEDVEMWFEDFLRSLYKHIVRYFIEFFKINDWKSYNVEFVFSVPIIWDSSAVIPSFRAILARAGFGEAEEHTISTELTEEEAMAKYASMGVKLQEGNILLVLDDGERSKVRFPTSSKEKLAG